MQAYSSVNSILCHYFCTELQTRRVAKLTLVMLNELRCHAHFQNSANQITWSRLLIQIHILSGKQCRSRSVGFFRSQLIWIYTVFKGRAYPGSAGPGLINSFISLFKHMSLVARKRLLKLSVESIFQCTCLGPLNKAICLGLWLKCPFAYPLHMMRNARKGPLCNLRTTQALITLHICAGWSGPLLPTDRINVYRSICWQTENIQIRLHGCACSSGPSLFAYGIRSFFPCCASYELEPLLLHVL